MAILNLKAQNDFIEKATNASGKSALTELIWNSLDADASEIYITSKKNELGHYDFIKIEDNGHGISHKEAETVFDKLGGSLKAIKKISPKGRLYHGKHGRGRIKAFTLGFKLTFRSYYQNNGDIKTFKIIHDFENIKQPVIDDIPNIQLDRDTGFIVKIENIRDDKIQFYSKNKIREEIITEFAAYSLTEVSEFIIN